jgi:hypothetical protein
MGPDGPEKVRLKNSILISPAAPSPGGNSLHSAATIPNAPTAAKGTPILSLKLLSTVVLNVSRFNGYTKAINNRTPYIASININPTNIVLTTISVLTFHSP